MSNFKTMKIKPQTATPSGEVIKNIQTHLDIVPTWVEKCSINSKHASIMSAGPSLEKYVKTHPLFKDENRKNNEGTKDRIWCVKHSIDRLVKLGVTPDYCVLLDGRDVEKNSTHGIKRLDLIKNAPKETVFFVASMSNPIYTQWLLDNDYTVIGWHALTEEMSHFKDQVKYAVGGGTCAALRTLGIAHTLGFRQATLFGVDSSFEKTPKVLPEQYIEVYAGTGEDRYGPIKTTGELVAQAQDIEKMLQDGILDLEINVECDGLVSEIMKRIKNATIKQSYEALLRIT